MQTKNRITIVILSIFLLLSATFCTSNYPQKLLKEVENDVLNERYYEAIEKIEIYFAQNEPDGQSEREYAHTRTELATFLKVCLIETGELNNKFFRYRYIPEMDNPWPPQSNENEYSSVPYFYQTIGFFAPAASMLNSQYIRRSKEEEYQKNFLRINYILGNKKWAQIQINRGFKPIPDTTEKWFIQAKEKIENSDIDTLIAWGNEEPSGNIAGFLKMYLKNKQLLEYHTLKILLRKSPSELPPLIERYNILGYERLPDYVQEALALSMQTPNRAIEERITKRVRDVQYEIEKTYREGKPTQDLVVKYGHTYTFYYYLVSFAEKNTPNKETVETPQISASH